MLLTQYMLIFNFIRQWRYLYRYSQYLVRFGEAFVFEKAPDGPPAIEEAGENGAVVDQNSSLNITSSLHGFY